MEKDTAPLVSIIVPIYNGRDNVPKIINNLNSQTYPRMEVIMVVDSRSTDESYDLAKKALDRLPEGSRVLLQTGTGKLGEARNMGMDCACGDIIWFLDADDTPLPSLLSETVSIMKNYGSDIVFFNHYSVIPNDNSALSKVDEKKITVSHMTGDDGLKWRLGNKLPIPSWAMIFKRKLVSENGLGFLTTNVAEDEDFAFRLLSEADEVSYYNKPLYIYSYNPDAWWRERNEIWEYIEIFLNLSDYFLDKNPEFEREFTPSVLRACIHTSTRSKIEIYKIVSKDERFRGLVRQNLPRNLEAFVFLHFPSVYYKIVRRIVDDRNTPKIFDSSCLE